MAFLANLPAYRVKEAASDPNAVVVLPVASIEQHGPHLPVYTDTLIGEAIVKRLTDEKVPLWTLPTLPYGKSNEHIHFPGTFGLEANTLLEALDQIGASIGRSGFKRLALINSHGGNLALLNVAAREIRISHDLMVGVFNPLSSVDVRNIEPGLSEMEAKFGIHAGEVETSVMLAINPELVDLPAASGNPPNIFPKDSRLGFSGPYTVAWLSSDLAENGTLGDPSGASAEAGMRYLQEAARICQEALEEFSTLTFSGEPHTGPGSGR